MMIINELTTLLWSQIEGMETQARLVVLAAIAAVVAGIVLRLFRARSLKRLQGVLDRYAERQMEAHARLDVAQRQAGIPALISPRRSGVVAVVRG